MTERRTFDNIGRHTERVAATPWFFLLFFTAVFFFAQHDWYFSLSGGHDFIKSLDDLTDSLDQGNMPRRIAFLLLGVFSVVNMLRPRLRRFRIGGLLGWLILFFLGWTFLSVAWSENPALTARRLAVLGATCLGAFVASRRFSPRDANLWVLLSTFLYLNLGIAAEIAFGTFSPLSAGYRFAGTLHPNEQGMNCALLLIAAVFILREGPSRRGLLYVVAAEALVFLVLTKSRTSFVLALSAPLLCHFLASRFSRKGAAILVAVSAACLVVLLGDLVLPTLQKGILLGRGPEELDTLTGRVPIWEQALHYISKRFIEGYGYDSFWTFDHITDFWKRQRWAAPNAHSAYVECALGLGIVGLALFVLIIVIAIRRIVTTCKGSRNAGFGFFGSVLIFAALDGLLESAFIQPSYISFVCALAVATVGFPGSSPARKRQGYRREDACNLEPEQGDPWTAERNADEVVR